MLLYDLFTQNLYELLLIIISAYVLLKADRTRGINKATQAFGNFAAANLIFQLSSLGMNLYREDVVPFGLWFGYFIYILAILSMAAGAYFWLIYVEEVTGSGLLDTERKKLLWALPLFILALLCLISIKTGWLFYFNANGKYDIGPFFFMQYVLIYGYVLMAMARSGINYLNADPKNDADRILLDIAVVDTAAAVIQLIYPVFTIDIAYILTLLLGYINVYAEEAHRVRQQEEDNAANYNRFFALEDDFMSLYDIELESGRFVSFDKDGFYSKNISERLVSQDEFFESLRANIDRVIYEEDREAAYNFQQKDNIVKELSGKDHIDNYYRVITDNGPMWLKMRIVYKDADKKNVIIGVFNAEEEMTAKQRDERVREELRQTNSRLFALEDNFESLYDVELESGHYDVFVKGEFFRNNVLDKLSVPKDYFAELRANIDAVIYEEDREGLYNTLTRESIRRELSEADRFDYLYRINAENGPIWLKMRIVYKDAEKKNIIIGVFNAEKDVETQQLQKAFAEANEANKQLEAAREEADKANRSKSVFLFNMSHDIRTPMNAILGFTAMAKKNADDKEKVTDYLEKIDISGQQLLTLINQVLEMARIESGKIGLADDPIDVRQAFASMVTVLSEQAGASGLEFRHQLGRIEHNHILADEARMSSITLNILGNAMKYTPEGGTVFCGLEEVPARRPGCASFVFTVSDTGIGMSEEYLKELYTPFSREKSSTVSKIQGTGLGLSIVKNLVDLMGGKIEVESKPGKGTRFDITLDFRIDENAGNGPDETDPAAPVSFKGRRVLLVEDNEMNREIARDVLEEQGLIVEDAEDGDVAVAMVRDAIDRGETGYYDFILMDVQMPRMNGYEATKAIRALPPAQHHIPIIAMTANAFEEDRQNALAAGMDEHLAKPIDVQKVFRTISKFL